MIGEFYKEKHIAYIKAISNDKESFEFTASQHFRMSGVYWGMTALSLLIGEEEEEEETDQTMNKVELLDWVMKSQHINGG